MKKLAILSILVLAVILRLYNIDYGLPDKERIFYYFPDIPLSSAAEEDLDVYGMLGTLDADEVDVLGAISNFEPSKFNFNPKHFYWGCLYFYVSALALKVLSLFGVVMLDPSKIYYFIHPEEFAKLYITGRMITVIFSIAAIMLLYKMGKKFYGTKTGLISAFFLSSSPVFLYYSRVMLPDMLMVSFGILSLYFCLRLKDIKDEQKLFKYYLLMGISFGLSTGTKYLGLLLFFPILFTHFLKVKNSRSSFLLNKYFIASIFAAGITFLLVNPYILLDFNTAKNQLLCSFPNDERLSLYQIDFNPLFCFKSIIFQIPKLLIGKYGVFIFLMLIFTLLYGIFSSNYESKILAIVPLTFYVFLGMIKPPRLWLAMHYFLMALPIIILLGTAFLFHFMAKTNRSASRAVAGFMILIGIMTSWNFLSNEYFVSRTDPRLEAAEWIVKNIKPAASIGVVNKNYYRSLPISRLRFKLRDIRQSDALSGQQLDYFVIFHKGQLLHFPPHLSEGKFKIAKTIEKKIKSKFLFCTKEPVKITIFKGQKE